MEVIAHPLRVGFGHLVLMTKDISGDLVCKFVTDIIVTPSLVHLFTIQNGGRITQEHSRHQPACLHYSMSVIIRFQNSCDNGAILKYLGPNDAGWRLAIRPYINGLIAHPMFSQSRLSKYQRTIFCNERSKGSTNSKPIFFSFAPD